MSTFLSAGIKTSLHRELRRSQTMLARTYGGSARADQVTLRWSVAWSVARRRTPLGKGGRS
ncbi:MAG: hypothetical protein ACK5PT_10940, partial [Cereibacter sp.]